MCPLLRPPGVLAFDNNNDGEDEDDGEKSLLPSTNLTTALARRPRVETGAGGVGRVGRGVRRGQGGERLAVTLDQPGDDDTW